MILSPCGIDCESCKDYTICSGCTSVKGKPFHIEDYGLAVCPLYDCAVIQKHYQTCAECPEVPCQTFHDYGYTVNM